MGMRTANPTNFIDPFGLTGAGTAYGPAPAPPAPPPVKAPPLPQPEPPLPVTQPPPSWWPGLGAIFGRGAIAGALELLFPPATARDEDLLPKNKPKCDRKDDPCYIQYLEDAAWCGEVFTDDEQYEKCMGDCGTELGSVQEKVSHAFSLIPESIRSRRSLRPETQ